MYLTNAWRRTCWAAPCVIFNMCSTYKCSTTKTSLTQIMACYKSHLSDYKIWSNLALHFIPTGVKIFSHQNGGWRSWCWSNISQCFRTRYGWSCKQTLIWPILDDNYKMIKENSSFFALTYHRAPFEHWTFIIMTGSTCSSTFCCFMRNTDIQGDPAKARPTYIFDGNIWMHR